MGEFMSSLSRVQRRRKKFARLCAMRTELAANDAIASSILSEGLPPKRFKQWTGEKTELPVGPIWLATSYQPTRDRCEGEACIYGLADPRDHVIRYVGKTHATLAERLWQHEFTPSNRRVGAWLRRLRREGVSAEIIVIEICLKYRWHRREEFWIAAMKPAWHLLNISLGGRWDAPRNRKGKEWGKARARTVGCEKHGPVRFLSRDEIAAMNLSR